MKWRAFAEEYPPYDKDVIVGYWYEGFFHQYITKCDEIGRFWVPIEFITAQSFFTYLRWEECLYWCSPPEPPKLEGKITKMGYHENDIGRFY